MIAAPAESALVMDLHFQRAFPVVRDRGVYKISARRCFPPLVLRKISPGYLIVPASFRAVGIFFFQKLVFVSFSLSRVAFYRRSDVQVSLFLWDENDVNSGIVKLREWKSGEPVKCRIA